MTSNQRQPKETNHEASEHETHTTSLIFLALATLVIVGAVLAVNRSSPSLNPGNYDQEDTTVPKNQPSQESHGSVIPTENVQTQDQSGLSGFPEGMYLPDDREIARNFSADLTDTTSQRVVIYDTNRGAQTIKDDFTQWVESSSFRVTDTSETTIRSNDGSEQLIMSISDTDDSRRVQVNYVQTN